jgi:Amt family ammonium transporter
MGNTEDIAALVERVTSLESALATSNGETDTFFLLWAGAIVFLMQAGFATLSAGSIRSKNVKNILLKNLMDACMGAMVFYFIGYGFAYESRAEGGNAFIGLGADYFGLSGLRDQNHALGYDWISWYFQFAFAAAAATIVSGAVAERCTLTAYLIYTCFITGFIYPVVVHWVWDGHGWLSAFNTNSILAGCIDFAGSGVVHMTGGWAAMVGAKILGPRLGRFENPAAFEGHSTPLVIIGTFLLWFGWYGFNPGSTLAIHGYARDAARACVTTTLSAAAGGVSGLFIKKLFPAKLGGTKIWDVGHTCNSLLGGLVGITAGCSVVSSQHAVLIGVISALVYHLASCTMRKLKIDDPLDAFAVHGACGVWGVWAVGLFAMQQYSYAPPEGHAARLDADGNDLGADAGLFMPGTRGLLFVTQLITPLIEICWVVTMSGIMFGVLKVTGIFRVTADEETAGMDVSKHGGDAYSSKS